jgi:hypothetical protein
MTQPMRDEMVSHKATRDCPMTEPHPRSLCGIVQARERNRQAADAARRESSGR